MLAAQLAAHFEVEAERTLDLVLHERLLDLDVLQLRGEGRVAAVVAPVGVEDAQLRFVGFAPLLAEVAHHLAQVVAVHRQAVRLAVGFQLGIGHAREAFEHRHGAHVGLLGLAQHRHVLLARLDGIDAVAADALHLLSGHRIVEDVETRGADAHIGLGVDQAHAIHGRSGPLVELARQALHGQVLRTRKVAAVRHAVRGRFAEHGITALFEQLLRKAEEVVDIQQAQRAQIEVQVVVQLAAQALGLHAEPRLLLDENSVVLHYMFVVFVLFSCSLRHPPRGAPAVREP